MFLDDTDKKILHNTVMRKVDGLLLQQKFSLEERRERWDPTIVLGYNYNVCYSLRLRNLISSEEELYLTETASKEETLLQRQARMRERARTLRERREKERVAEVEIKLERRWRYIILKTCVHASMELLGYNSETSARNFVVSSSSKILQRSPGTGANNSGWKKKREKGQKSVCINYDKSPAQLYWVHAEEVIYARMWKEDWEVKSKREEMEAVQHIERNKETLDVSEVSYCRLASGICFSPLTMSISGYSFWIYSRLPGRKRERTWRHWKRKKQSLWWAFQCCHE